jgi:hypothetical protein
MDVEHHGMTRSCLVGSYICFREICCFHLVGRNEGSIYFRNLRHYLPDYKYHNRENRNKYFHDCKIMKYILKSPHPALFDLTFNLNVIFYFLIRRKLFFFIGVYLNITVNN